MKVSSQDVSTHYDSTIGFSLRVIMLHVIGWQNRIKPKLWAHLRNSIMSVADNSWEKLPFVGYGDGNIFIS